MLFSSGHLEEEELEKFNITTLKRMHATKHKLGKQPMMTKTRVMLDNFYRSDTEAKSVTERQTVSVERRE